MTFQFKIQLQGISKPPVWRRLLLSEKASFEDFHQAIQVAFGWLDCHLYSFSQSGHGSKEFIERHKDYIHDDPDINSKDAEKTFLKNIFKKENQKYTYIYDFGDDWTHKITLEKITEEVIEKPKCLAGKGKCPPEDCGGVWGYEDFLKTINNPKDPEYNETREWVGLEDGEKWDTNEFDLEEINEAFE